MMGPELRFEQDVRTHVGAIRKINEDAHIARPLDGLWAVADGMGGHINGQWASATIVNALEAAILGDDFEMSVTRLTNALQDANWEILEASRVAGGAIGSTVAALLITGMRYAVIWAGDSRVYRCRDRSLTLLTTDHSQVEQMVAAGLLRREEAENHPMGHVLSRAIGVHEDLELDRIDGDVLPGDVFMLCSDGLSRLMDFAEIQQRLIGEPPRMVASTLVKLALDRGAPDNVTVAVVGCDATTLVGVI